MKKKSTIMLIFILFSLMTLQTTMQTVEAVPSVVDIWTIRDTAKWQLEILLGAPDTYVSSKIKGDTLNNWLVELEIGLMGLVIPGFSFGDLLPKLVSKETTINGFHVLPDGNVWGLWIDPDQMEETDALTINNNLTGILDCTDIASFSFLTSLWLSGPLTFEIEAGKMKFEGTTYDVWICIAETSDSYIVLYYEYYFGILLQADFLPKSDTNFMFQASFKLTATSINLIESDYFIAQYFGASMLYQISAIAQGQSISIISIQIDIFAESTKKVFVQSSYQYGFYMPFFDIVEKSMGTPFGFCKAGHIWGLWINCSATTTSSYGPYAFNMSRFIDLAAGMSSSNLQGPFTLSAYSGSTFAEYSSSIHNAWIFNDWWGGRNLTLYYDKTNGILLKAAYNISMGTEATCVMTLKEFVMPSPGFIPGFTQWISFLGILSLVFLFFQKKQFSHK